MNLYLLWTPSSSHSPHLPNSSTHLYQKPLHSQLVFPKQLPLVGQHIVYVWTLEALSLWMQQHYFQISTFETLLWHTLWYCAMLYICWMVILSSAHSYNKNVKALQKSAGCFAAFSFQMVSRSTGFICQFANILMSWPNPAGFITISTWSTKKCCV